MAYMLESDLGDRITTARLAKEVGVSEAALYRHFPNKTKIYESLLDFCEESLFSRINTIASEPQSTDAKCFKIASLVLSFCQKNAGISRLLTGEVLLGETERLKTRVSQVFDKLEVNLKQIIRNSAIDSNQSAVDAGACAKLITSVVEGRVQQFVRSSFKIDPMANWETQWRLLQNGIQLS